MKAFKEYAILFAVGAAAALVADFLLYPLWFYLGWRKPVSDWLLAIGLPAVVAAYWGMVWVNLPGWVMAIGAGLFVGTTRRHSAWVAAALLACAAFLLTPYVYMLALGYSLGAGYGPGIAVRVLLWHSVAIPLVLLAA